MLNNKYQRNALLSGSTVSHLVQPSSPQTVAHQAPCPPQRTPSQAPAGPPSPPGPPPHEQRPLNLPLHHQQTPPYRPRLRNPQLAHIHEHPLFRRPILVLLRTHHLLPLVQHQRKLPRRPSPTTKTGRKATTPTPQKNTSCNAKSQTMTFLHETTKTIPILKLCAYEAPGSPRAAEIGDARIHHREALQNQQLSSPSTHTEDDKENSSSSTRFALLGPLIFKAIVHNTSPLRKLPARSFPLIHMGHGHT
ncbi:hypothetical protein CCMA1212_002640 [Trichoderma ghanense]|uniref:Uncharacterized protein n=1 Tax=Trichoderma ghanense TaxID=65468 RepID=A0ABY2H9W0_9HYPO